MIIIYPDTSNFILAQEKVWKVNILVCTGLVWSLVCIKASWLCIFIFLPIKIGGLVGGLGSKLVITQGGWQWQNVGVQDCSPGRPREKITQSLLGETTSAPFLLLINFRSNMITRPHNIQTRLDCLYKRRNSLFISFRHSSDKLHWNLIKSMVSNPFN